MKFRTLPLAAAVAVFALSACGASPEEAAEARQKAQTQVLLEAADSCNRVAEAAADGSHSIDAVDAIYKDPAGSITTYDPASYLCLADQLDAPQSLRTRVGNTTGMMGGQEDTSGDFTWFWSYNKNNTPEFQLTITLADEE